MVRKAYIYWIHLAEHTDIRTQGYIGVSQQPDRRLCEHKRGKGYNPHLKSALEKYGENVLLSLLVYNTEDYCYEMERVLRPVPDIGWNVCEGGSKPPVLSGDNHPMKRPEARAKMSKARKGQPSWRKGQSWSQTHKQKMSELITQLHKDPTYKERYEEGMKKRVVKANKTSFQKGHAYIPRKGK